MGKSILIIGAGAIGLSTALHCARQGHQVTVLERNPARRDGCSYGNAGMIVPSHFVPLAAPGMVKLGLKWMGNPASPFYIKPRLDADLLDWGLKFWRAANPEHVRRSTSADSCARQLPACQSDTCSGCDRGGHEARMIERTPRCSPSPCSPPRTEHRR